ncbi:MAG TPA: SH3 domain-containing protein [Beijerinckiaceae bacterium]|nr:SH3 domain-containing protein [Beijerinckiaceae bacterium]
MSGFRFWLVMAGLAAVTTPALAGNCIGTVQGLASSYDPARGSGFLAVRSGPSTGAEQIGELFNGDRVDTGKSSGPWVYVIGESVEGWVHGRWLRIRCP